MDKEFISFIERTSAFEQHDKLKLLLVATHVKPATYVHLRISTNLDDKYHFERFLKRNNIPFIVSRAKGYEEITKIDGNAVLWHLRGIWYGYDIFKDQYHLDMFLKYKKLVKARKHQQADRLAGALYGYPLPAIERYLITHSNLNAIAKQTTFYKYYHQIETMRKKFPFIQHIPATPSCTASANLNRVYKATIKKFAPRFYASFTKRRTFTVPLIVESELKPELHWKKADAHQYSVLTAKPIEKKYWLLPLLTKKKFGKGDVFNAKVIFQYDTATITAGKITDHIARLHHERHLRA